MYAQPYSNFTLRFSLYALFMPLIIAIIGITIGIFYLKYNYQITNVIGRFPGVENVLGQGGTYLFHKLIALAIIILSIMWAFGTLQTALQDIIGPFFSSQ